MGSVGGEGRREHQLVLLSDANSSRIAYSSQSCDIAHYTRSLLLVSTMLVARRTELLHADDRRLAGAGYCFSAALPPFLATAAIAAIDIIESAEGPALLKSLDANARALRSLLSESDCGLEVAKGDGSPVVMMRLKGDEVSKLRSMSFVSPHTSP